MFECLSLVAATDLNFIYHDDDDNPAVLSQKAELLARFVALDPDGAGGPAADYWSGW
jgi:hypothetical protein